jgi:chromosome segregation ATPase
LYISVLEEKVKALTKLYLEQFKANHDLVEEVNNAQYNINSLQATFASGKIARDRETKAIRRILAAQLEDVCSQLDKTAKVVTASEGKIALLTATNKKLKSNLHSTVVAKDELDEKLQSVTAQLSTARKEKRHIQASLDIVEEKLAKTEKSLVTANTKIQNQKDIEKNNLIYNRKIESSAQQLKEKDSTITDLRKELRKTVEECENLQSEVSNRDDEIGELTQRVEACEHLLGEYQQACVDNYADILGVQVNVPVTSTTSVSELKSLVYGSVGGPSVSAHAVSEPVEIVELNDDDIVTL